MTPQATCSLCPIPMTGAPAAVTPRTLSVGEWSSTSTSRCGIRNPSCGPVRSHARPSLRIAHIFDPPSDGTNRSSATDCDAEPSSEGSGSRFAYAEERRNARRSSLRVRPGRDGKSPAERGTVPYCPGVRSGKTRSKIFGPTAWNPSRLASSSPSSLGVVRARKMPIAAISCTWSGSGVAPSAANSAGSFDGSVRTSSIHALTPSA